MKNDKHKDQRIAERCNNIMIYGLNNENINLSGVLTKLRTPVEDMIDCVELKKKENDLSFISSYRVTLSHPAMVARALREAANLKHAGGFYSKVYVTPDRTPEQRKIHSDLVLQLKQKILSDPSRRWTIRKGKVVDTGVFFK